MLTHYISSVYFGFGLAYFSTIDFEEYLINIYGIMLPAATAKGLLIGCIPIGGGIGALLCSALHRFFSRRYFFLDSVQKFDYLHQLVCSNLRLSPDDRN